MKAKWILLSSVVLAAGCKTGNQETSMKSLDNFTGAADVVNSCSGDEPSLAPKGAIVAPKESHVAAVEKALTAVPSSLQRAYFNNLKGRIEIGEIPAGCRLGGAASQQALDSAMLSCFSQDASGAVVIHVADAGADTERNIGHALVRTLGYVVSEVLLSFPGDASLSPVKADHLTQLESNLTILANADLTAQGKGDLAARIDDSVRDNMFPEAFDSRYCSAETKASFVATFPMTAQHFEEQFAAELETALASSDTATSEGTMYLWGRWGFGNGPLRQAFGNWLDWRASGNGLFNVRRWADGGGFVFQRPWFAPWRWEIYDYGYAQDGYVYYQY